MRIVSSIAAALLACAGATPEPVTTRLVRDVAARDRLYAKGQELAKQSRHAEALTMFEASVAADPIFALGHLEAAESHFVATSDLGKIVAHLERAIELLPDSPRAHTRIGDAYAGLGRADEALAAFRRALSLDADYTDAHFSLAALLTQRGARAEAVGHLEAAVRLEPDNVQARVRLAQHYADLARPEEAARHVERAAELAGRSAPLYRRAAALFEDAGLSAEAERVRAVADALDPPPERREYRPLRPSRSRKR